MSTTDADLVEIGRGAYLKTLRTQEQHSADECWLAAVIAVRSRIYSDMVRAYVDANPIPLGRMK